MTQWTKPSGLADGDLVDFENDGTATAEPIVHKIESQGRHPMPARMYTADTAACAIQRMVRCALARQRLRCHITRVYTKIWDPTQDRYYYYNTQTRVVSWTKPRWVNDRALLTPRGHAAFMATLAQEKKEAKLCRIRRFTPNEAAVYLQGRIRQRLARRRVQHMMQHIYQALVDPETGQTFYHNCKTGEVRWTKPALL